MFNNHLLRKNLFLIIWFISFLFLGGNVSAGLPGSRTIIWPDQGVEFFQLDLTFTKATQMDSPYGLLVADFNSLYENTGISKGFLNVMTEPGWVVRNMPVEVSSGYPGLSTMFNLGSLEVN